MGVAWLEYLFAKLGTEGVSLVLPIIGALTWALLKFAGAQLRHFNDFLASRRRALGAVARTWSPNGPSEGNGVWALKPIVQPDNYRIKLLGAHVVAIANLKGGVGKTTIAANVAAHLASDPKWQKRVLLIDLDYQGSLSSMAFPDDISWLPPVGTDSIATRALSGDLEPNLFLAACKEVRDERRLKIVTSYYDLAQADSRLLVEWLLSVRQKDRRSWSRWFADLFVGHAYRPAEMRYNLCELLHTEAVNQAFDLIIIDCPPRLTTGTIQAFCASSAVLIPTILDRPSSESVVSFCGQINALRAANLCPHLKTIGVAPTRYANQVAQRAAMQNIKDQLRDRKMSVSFVPDECFIPQTTTLVREASEGIAYFRLDGSDQARRARMAFGALATYVAHQLGVPPALRDEGRMTAAE